MCGRYVFFQRASAVRQQLADANMPSQEAPDDDAVRTSYNFAPGYYGLVYRADTSDYGAGPARGHQEGDGDEDAAKAAEDEESGQAETTYKLQAMKWGLVPSWTKRNPDYGNLMRTINCRDDSLAENKGMWVSMKKKKRCIVVCQGFYEWLKKKNGKERIPHYIKRKDGQLMCFAGLWDVVQYEGSDEKHYTYTVITTDSNKQLNFLHDRMPVIFNPGSDAVTTWLDPGRYEWSKDLQSLLKPWDGELEIYPVNKDVGKVGNDSPTFIIPIDSTENKSNIANFFNKPANGSKGKPSDVKTERTSPSKDIKTEEADETPVKDENSETHAPAEIATDHKPAIKREHDEVANADSPEHPAKVAKTADNSTSPVKPVGRKMHSATSNGSASRSPAKGNQAAEGSKKITNFFVKK